MFDYPNTFRRWVDQASAFQLAAAIKALHSDPDLEYFNGITIDGNYAHFSEVEPWDGRHWVRRGLCISRQRALEYLYKAVDEYDPDNH